MKGLYARISDDSEATGLGVERQLKDCRGLVALREWQCEEYVDNDVSAYNRRVKRPRFEQMLTDLKAGRLSGVVVYNLDRLARQPRDLERLLDIYEEHPELTFATLEGDINLATSDGRTMARVMVAFANKASADTGRRTKRKHLELAEAGKPVGRRTFGWKQDKVTLDPTEAAIARQGVDDLIDGKPLRVLAREWEEAGVLTTVGKPWSPQAMRNYYRNPRLVGERTYQGAVLLDPSGEPVQGTWEPLLDRDTWDRLQVRLRPTGAAASGRRGSRKHLLSGLLRCGICSRPMYASAAREEGRFNYVCNHGEGERHSMCISGLPTDRVVGEVAYRKLQEEAVRPQETEGWDGQARLDEIKEQIDALMAGFLDGTLSQKVVFAAVQKLENEQAEMQTSRTQWLVRTTGPAVRQMTREEWDDLLPFQRREHIEKHYTAVLVKPPARGRSLAERLDPVAVER